MYVYVLTNKLMLTQFLYEASILTALSGAKYAFSVPLRAVIMSTRTVLCSVSATCCLFPYWCSNSSKHH